MDIASAKNKSLAGCLFCILFSLLFVANTLARDLDEVLKSGTLRHLAIPYANFVTEDKSGLDVELMQRFAAHLGVRYELVETTWQNAIADLTGSVVKPKCEEIEIVGTSQIRGDIIATGFTVLPWREKIVDYSIPTFPTGVWLIANADSKLEPIKPSGNIDQDIAAVKKLLPGHTVLTLPGSCLASNLYGLEQTGAKVELFAADRDLAEMIPAVMARVVETTLMDVPVALIALEKWQGEIKVVGPISPLQQMACAFPKSSPNLRKAFNDFFLKTKADGSYKKLVEKYYPTVFGYYGDFFD